MARRWDARRLWIVTGRTLLVLVATIAVLLAGVAMLSSHLRGPLIKYAESHYARRIWVAGKLEVDLLARHPRIIAERVSVGNPHWTPTGLMAEIGHLTLTYDWPVIGHLRAVQMRDVTLHLLRDEAGRANWQGRDPALGTGPGPRPIHSLSMPGARVYLEDRRRHLQF